MKKSVAIAAILLGTMAPAGAGQMPKYGVTVNAEKNVDFSAFKTYSWTKGQPSHVKAIDAQIVAAVDRELAALGMTKATSGHGDVLATYYSLTRTDANVNAKPDKTGALPQQSVGTLMVGLLDPATRRRLLRLRADKPIATEPAQLEAAINTAVSELFAQYPTKTAKKK